MNRIKQFSKGDTIVEVLIALTVVSMMLGGAYVLANRSLNNSRSSQERAEAVRIAEAQLERLNSSIKSGDDEAYTTTNIFCMNSDNEVRNATQPSQGSIPSLSNDDFNVYTSTCTSQNQSLPYYMAIERLSENRFRVHVRWDRLGAVGRNEVTFVHRIYQ